MKRSIALLALFCLPAFATELPKSNTAHPYRDLEAGKTYEYTFTVPKEYKCVLFKTAPTAGTKSSELTIILGKVKKTGNALAIQNIPSDGSGRYKATVTAKVATRIGVGFYPQKNSCFAAPSGPWSRSRAA